MTPFLFSVSIHATTARSHSLDSLVPYASIRLLARTDESAFVRKSFFRACRSSMGTLHLRRRFDAPLVVKADYNEYVGTRATPFVPSVESSKRQRGTVYLVGAGPGDPGLITVKGKALLEEADVVLYDHLVSPDILAMIKPSAELIDVGKERTHHKLAQEDIGKLLIEKACSFRTVVRLKGGDPFVFGRGAEEMEDLAAAGVDAVVVPGITSGIAAPAYADIPITHREYSSSVTFVTGHELIDKSRTRVNWHAIANGSETIVIYMGMHNLEAIARELTLAGCRADLPVAVIRWGTWQDKQAELVGDLSNIADLVREHQFKAPAICIIGDVVKVRERISRARLSHQLTHGDS
mmetsp:Transcript_44046/g.71713  ORF Transcript_44046/g.71713 Transcript_44046/m.71713 type:complete len:351 (+) Transcript_44046:194-1246(+)